MAAGEATDPQPRTRSRSTTVWNVIGYLLYAAMVAAGLVAVWISLFFAMATDGCHDSACDASYHVYPAMLTMWIGVPVALLLTLVVMLVQSIRGKIVVVWPLLGLLALGGVYLMSLKILH